MNLDGGGTRRKRRPLYGGGADPRVEIFLNVIEPLLFMAANQILIDTEDMKEAVISQREYYTRGVDLLTKIQKQPPTPELALGVYDLLCCSRFAPTKVFQEALHLPDDYSATTLQLFFSGLESYSLMEPPAFAGTFLKHLPKVNVTASVEDTKGIRKAADSIIRVIADKYSIPYPPLIEEEEPSEEAEPTPEQPVVQPPPETPVEKVQPIQPDIVKALPPPVSSPPTAVAAGGKRKTRRRRRLFTTP